MKTNVALIGFMGSGKSQAGEMLALKLGKKFIETDLLIEQRAGKSITAIFKQHGEPFFRQLEHEVIRDVSREQNAVIACGGGTVLREDNVDLLRKNAVIVYLAIAPSIAIRRLATGVNRRPLLDVPDLVGKIKLMMEDRKPLYERAADIRINATNMSREILISRIMQELLIYADKNSDR